MDHIIQARKNAEQAVADMPEGELRTKAFEVILKHILSATHEGNEDTADAYLPINRGSRKAAKSRTTGLPNPHRNEFFP